LRQADSTLPSAEEIDAVLISHGHNDHTGGLRSFLESNTTAKVYLHSSIQGNLYFSCRNRGASTTSPGIMEARSIGMEQSLFAEYGHRFVQVSEPVSITGQITLVPTGNSSNAQPKPLGNKYLYCNDLPDNFTHEIAILAEYTPGAFAVISPCSHNGILNILPIRTSSHGAKYFIGGLHYVDYLGGEDAKKEAAQIIQAAEIIRDKYPQMKIVSGHCTCAKAGEMIKSVLGDRYKTFCSGYSILL
jgi:7,8-dihydropterin-6-yl-methyl-4-(beta-D-ribofuranosyl)aminobenzene 5'-phosphate synthase